MSGTNVESGWLAGNLPFIRLGRGEKRVVILPGLADAAWEVTRHTGDSAEHYRRFADGFTLYVISRQRGLPADYTTREMAADYGRAIREEIGPVIVLGISLGGCIAQHLAADFPELVERLVIACAGYRVSEEGRKIPERWLALAREKRWREFYFDIAKVTLREFHHTFYQFLLPMLRRETPDPADFLVSLEACIGHNGTAALPRIHTPTLVIGGSKDVFFPPAMLQETARLIPRATLCEIDGGRHGMYELQKETFENAVLDFLHNGTGVA